MSAFSRAFPGCVADGGDEECGVVVVKAGDGVARSTGMLPARLADSWRMRRSPPYLHQWRPAAKLKKASTSRPRRTTPADYDGWMWDLSVPGNNDRDFHVETAVVAVLVQNDDGCPTSPNRMQRQVSRRQVPSHPGGTATATPTAGGGRARRCVTVLNSGEPVGRFATFVAAGVAFRGP
jgi:hypothetical protein